MSQDLGIDLCHCRHGFQSLNLLGSIKLPFENGLSKIILFKLLLLLKIHVRLQSCRDFLTLFIISFIFIFLSISSYLCTYQFYRVKNYNSIIQVTLCHLILGTHYFPSILGNFCRYIHICWFFLSL